MFDDYFYSSNYQNLKRNKLDLWLKEVQNLVVIELGAGKAIPTVRRFFWAYSESKKGRIYPY